MACKNCGGTKKANLASFPTISLADVKPLAVLSMNNATPTVRSVSRTGLTSKKSKK